MQYIANISFFVAPGKGEEFVSWFRPLVSSYIDKAVCAGINPRLSRLSMETLNMPVEGEAESFSFQVEFADASSAASWLNAQGARLTEEFMARFLPDAMTFPSLSEVINL